MLAHIQDLARFAAEGILNSLLAGVAIALFAWAVTRFARQGSGTRFIVWFVALSVIATLPWVGSVGTSSRLTVPALAAGGLTLPKSLATYLFLAWVIGASFGMARVAFSLFRLQRLRSTCIPVRLEELDPNLRTTIANAFAHRRAMICTSDLVRVPAAIGYIRPMVVFPSWALREIPTDELNAILLHELAHLRRWDDWTNLAQKLVKALFFFHPAVWFIESRLTLEREMACDDAVLAANFSPRAYAESLVGLAERSFLRHGIQLAQAAVGHVQQLKLRIIQILSKDRVGRGSLVRRPTIAVIALAGLISIYGASRAPRLIAFSSDAPKPAVDAMAISALARPRSVSVGYNVRNNAFLPVSNRSSHAADRSGQAKTRRVALTPRVDLTQRVARYQVSNDEAAPPMLVLSNFSTELMPTPVLVIFQGQQFGVNGPVLWRVTVLHLSPAQQRAIAGGFPKQI